MLGLALVEVHLHEVTDRDPAREPVLHVRGHRTTRSRPSGVSSASPITGIAPASSSSFFWCAVSASSASFAFWSRSFSACCAARGVLELLALRVELARQLLQAVDLARVGLRRRLRVLLRRADVLHVLDVGDRGARRVGVAVDVRGALADDRRAAGPSRRAWRRASAGWCRSRPRGRRAAGWPASTCALSWVSICWFWLTWLARAAKASGSGFGVVDVAGARGRGGDRAVGGGAGRGRWSTSTVVVDDSWAAAAVAGTRNTVTSAPATQLRVPGACALYRRERRSDVERRPGFGAGARVRPEGSRRREARPWRRPNDLLGTN